MEFNYFTRYQEGRRTNGTLYVLQGMRTEQDKINRKEANQRYYKLEENKEQKRNYMKLYREKKKREASNEELHIKNSERFVNNAQR